VNQNLGRYEALRKFTSLTMFRRHSISIRLNSGNEGRPHQDAVRAGSVPKLKRPANLEDLAFAPLTHLAYLLKSRQVTSVELTEMYLARLKKFNRS